MDDDRVPGAAFSLDHTTQPQPGQPRLLSPQPKPWPKLQEHVPEYTNTLLATFQWSINNHTSAVYGALPYRAQRDILTLAINDFTAVIERVLDLDGRSAAMRARALFEHLINFADVTRSTVNTRERYSAHAWVTQLHASEANLHLDIFEGNDRIKEERRLAKLHRDAAPRVRDAVAKYGNDFKRSWAKGTLLDRAKAHGYDDGYNGYRVLSSAIHGASGSLTGIIRPHGDYVTYRIGADYDLAAFAWQQGAIFWDALIDLLGQVADVPEISPLRTISGALVYEWQTIRRRIRALDQGSWPEMPPLTGMTVATIYPSGKVQWRYHRLSDDQLLLAKPPNPAPDLDSAVKELPPAARGDTSEPLHIRLPMVRAQPQLDKGSVSATGLGESILLLDIVGG